MKQGIHPQILETNVHCNSCGQTFTSHSTVNDITVEICSNCHPFYTGKQKLLDVAGRVDKFKARQAAAAQKAEAKAERENVKRDKELARIQHDIQDETVDTETNETEAKA